MRPLGLAAALFVIRLIGLRWHGVNTDVTAMRALFRPQVIAAALTVLIVGTSLQINHGAAGGSDAFGYVRQADGWLAGDLTIDQEWLRDAPWLHLPRIAAPLGYRAGGWRSLECAGLSTGPAAALRGSEVAARAMRQRGSGGPDGGPSGGHHAQDRPAHGLTAGRCGRRVDRRHQPRRHPHDGVTDERCARGGTVRGGDSGVPAHVTHPRTAGRNHHGRRGAHAAESHATGRRPRVWLLLADRQAPTWRARAMRCAIFCAGAAPGAIGMALFNQSVYGSPTASGYGDLDGFFSWSYIAPNIWNYSTWLLQSPTPLVALGLAALAIPAGWLRKSHGLMQASVLVCVAACMLATHLPHQVFIDWWYLRFLLPAWPALAIGTAWLATNTTGRAYGRAGILALVLCGGWGLYYAYGHDSFRVGWGELRYVSAAHAVRAMTRPGSVILSSQHSGSVTYYGGRRSLRYDWIEPHRLDDVVRWLNDRNHDVYILLEEWEVERFRARFKNTPLGGLADASLVFHQKVSTPVFLYDTRPRAGNQVYTIDTFMSSAVRCCAPSR
ncbi:MAG: hypothetical protein IPL75_12870 [Acidobacteria bacterium]|nr:hypothetical protein [Acidobacteriota bacterium]